MNPITILAIAAAGYLLLRSRSSAPAPGGQQPLPGGGQPGGIGAPGTSNRDLVWLGLTAGQSILGWLSKGNGNSGGDGISIGEDSGPGGYVGGSGGVTVGGGDDISTADFEAPVDPGLPDGWMDPGFDE